MQCGGWYTIRLKLANVSDNALSSAVFLEENSLKGPVITVSDSANVGNTFNDSLMVEGCNKNQIIFARSSNLGVTMKIPIDTEGNAIEGQDFSTLPDTLYLLPGQTADTLTFWIYDDNIAEGIDTLIIVQDYVFTDCYDYPVNRMTYYLRDKDTLDASIVLMSSSDSVSCPGDSIELSVVMNSYEGDYYAYWSGDSVISLNRFVEVLSDTTYTFIVFDECGDTLELTQDIFLKPYTPMVYESDTVRVCPGDSAMLAPFYYGGEPPLSFYWMNNLSQNNPRTVLPYADTSFYEFSLTDGCSVFKLDSAQAIAMPAPLAGFQYLNDPYVPLRVLFDEKASNEVTWTWYLDSTIITGATFEYDFSKPGDYEVTQVVSSGFGCKDSITLIVAVETDFYMYIPTAFTPDNDGINDCFQIKGVGYQGYELVVLNRWGNEVYRTSDIDACWDGTLNGKELPMGAYSWRMIAYLPFDEIAIREGVLSLFR